ncbi:hypothetical protein DCAR_0624905 [Daucus carota subsp. sativus]|uniref:Uncharacterized protein n=1 Tax=Daucus carota subsp. sativus TaxID=79200 RepID=A0A164W3W0_DAUCS|nr:PREDICTED: uncharacterized protein LOC108226185 [Daucus carota subsp. sativus]WOH05488.1 hypothetical protein DCAR_0624905 [Daucus carota subsp. sativus]
MQPPHQHSRINLAELKAQIARKLGPDRSMQYFNCLKKLLGLKINKAEFHKVCRGIVGRENIPLHNQFISAILKNAYTAKVPPLLNEIEVLKANKAVGNKESPSDGYQQNGTHSAINQPPIHAGLSNGDILPLSPKKARTSAQNRRVGDRRSALGPTGKTNLLSQKSPTTDRSDCNVILENGESIQPDIRKAVHHHHGLNQETEFSRNHTTKISTVSAVDRISGQSKGKKDLFIKDDGTELSARRFLHPPLGIPICAASTAGSHRALRLGSSSKVVSSSDVGGLLDTTTLRKRMEHIAATQGLEGVSLDSANILNNGLDTYLKGLIRSSIALAGSRSGHGQVNQKIHKHQALVKLINGVSPSPHYRMQSNSSSPEVMHENTHRCPISMQDFKVAMELNPQQLGEDWPLLLEKICTCADDEEL